MENKDQTESDLEEEAKISKELDDMVEAIECDEIISLKAKLHSNPNNYDLHLQLMQELKKEQKPNQLRAARENMHEYFPLTEDLSLEWLNDEIESNTSNQQYISKLFEKILHDYHNVKIWLKYLQFTINSIIDRNEIDKVRELFERAVISVGLHVTEALPIWESYRDFEISIYQSLQSFDESNVNYKQQLLLQEKCIHVIFERHLSIPHVGIEETKKTYLKWSKTDKLCETIQNRYESAMHKLNSILTFEYKLSENEDDYQIYCEYIKVEKRDKNPSRVVCLYERAICKHCLEPAIWIDYLEYIRQILKDYNLLVDTHQRSIRNITWDASLWLFYIKTMELYCHDISQVNNALEIAVSEKGTPVCDHLKLELYFGCYLVRKAVGGQVDASSVIQYFTDTIERHKSYGSVKDSEGLLTKTLSYFYRDVLGDCVKAFEILATIVNGHERDSKFWDEYITVARRAFDTETTRSLFKNALSRKLDYPYDIARSYINFEHFFGNVESIREAERIVECASSMFKLRQPPKKEEGSRKRKVSPEPKNIKIKKSEIKSKEASDCKNNKQIEEKHENIKQQEITSVNSEKQKNVKTTEDVCISNKSLNPRNFGFDENLCVFLSNIDFNSDETEVNQMFSSVVSIAKVMLVRNQRGESKGYGYLQVNTQQDVKTALKNDRKIRIGSRPIFVSKLELNKDERIVKFKTSADSDSCLYVDKIDPKVSEENIKQFFGKFVGFKESRLSTYRNGNSKGFAYIEFDSKENATKALVESDNCRIGSKQINVYLSNPPKKEVPKMEVNIERKQMINLNIQSGENDKIPKLNMTNNDFRRMILKKD